MKQIAIVYATRKGQTEKIAIYIEQHLILLGHKVQRINVRQHPTPLLPDTEGVIVGGPVYAGRFPSALIKWVIQYKPQLENLTTGLFSVTLNAADKRPSARAADRQLLREFILKTDWIPNYVESVAGAMKYTQYIWPLRWLMKRQAKAAGGDTDTSRDYEYTDWRNLEHFVRAVSNDETYSVFATSHTFPDLVAYGNHLKEAQDHWSERSSLRPPPEGERPRL